MSKKIKITEAQLHMLVERRHTYEVKEEDDDEIGLTQFDDEEENDIEVHEPEEVNESIEKIKLNFKRFL